MSRESCMLCVSIDITVDFTGHSSSMNISKEIGDSHL